MDFTPEQQAHVDSLIKKKYAEVYSKAEQKAAETIAAAEAKYIEDLNTLRGQVDSLTASQGENKERVRQALLKAEVAQSSAVNSQQVMKLINDNIIIGEDGNLAVVGADGGELFTAEGRPYEVRVFVSEYLDQNPHLQRAARSTGAGSIGAIGPFSGTGAAKTSMRRGEFNNLSASQKSNFIQAGGRLTE